MSTFPSIEAFYAADARRRHSGELDFGVWWFARDSPRVPWRVSWVEDTGELYAIRLEAPRVTRSNDAIAILGGDDSGPVEILAIIPDEAALERRLEGWAAQCGGPESLEWLRARVQ